MDTFMNFISNAPFPGKKEHEQHEIKSNASVIEPIIKTEMDIDDNILEQQVLDDDDVLNEFLNSTCFEQPNNNDMVDFMDTEKENTDNINNPITNNTANTSNNDNKTTNTNSKKDEPDHIKVLSPSDELKMYENSKKELMKVKFGLNEESKYIPHSNVGTFLYTKEPVINNPDDPEVTTTLLPQEYQDSFLQDESSFPYKIKLEDLPKNSRVETQIKLDLTISPPPPQFLVHIPRDSITKPKLTLSDIDLSDSIKEHLLYLDLFVVGSQASRSNDGHIRSCNVCKRCMRRELKRASRRKAGLIDDSSNWDINLPKRAIIINSKEIVSFPPPNGDGISNERKLELLSRIVCYCRHHQELEGFQILIFLKDQSGKIVGKTISTPILIMDRKKSIKATSSVTAENKENVSSVSNLETASEMFTKSSNINTKKASSITSNISNDDLSAELSGVSTTTSINNNNNPSKSGLLSTSVSITNLNSMNILSSNNNKPGFSSMFSFDPSNLLGDENSRPNKRQKRPWSSSESTTYFENINQQRRIPSTTNTSTINPILDSRRVSVKKEPISPISSDAISPHNNLLSSATSAFSATPEKEYHEATTINTLSPEYHDIEMQSQNVSDSLLPNNLDLSLDSNMGINLKNVSMDNINNLDISNVNNTENNINTPTIRRIIPAQGPVRGGIEITLLGSNFRPGLIVKFGRNVALATQCWSDSTIVTYLPPASQAGPVLVTFEDTTYDFTNSSAHQIFTYTDDTDRQLIELALQIVGLKMNGKLEDAKNIAKRIVGSNQMDCSTSQTSQSSQNSQHSPSYVENSLNQQLQLNWMAVASNKIKELSKTSLNHEEILIRFLSMIKIPNSLISTPNWAVCNFEGQTMLHLACIKNYNKLAQFLIKNGSRVDYKDNNGFSPLHFAFINGNRKIINLLTKFKANVSNKLDNGVLLSDIADSNVLDLMNSARRPSASSSDDYEEDDDDDEEEEDDYIEEGDEELEDVDIENENKETTQSYKSRSRHHLVHRHYRYQRHISSSVISNDEDDSDFEADNEDEMESISDKALLIDEANVIDPASGDGMEGTNDTDKDDTNSFGYNLWVAMKEAIKNKMVEVGTKQSHKTKPVSSETKKQKVDSGIDNENKETQDTNEDGEQSEEHLPAYDDLFPQGTSLRSLINFRGHDDDSSLKKDNNMHINNNEESTTQTESNEVGITVPLDSDEADGDDVDLIARNLQTSIDADTKLLFFWLPCMLLLLLIVIGNNLNIITIQNFQYFSYFLGKVREVVGSFMLGKDRFTNLINENINYGRERMENLINDVNDVMMTAVAGVGR